MFSSLTDPARRLVNTLLRILEKFKPTAVVVIMVRNAGTHGVGDMAAAVGYYGILAILPLLIFTITVLSFVLDTQTVVNEVHTVVSQYVPMEVNFIDESVDAIVQSRGAIGIVSLLALLWSGSNFFGAMARFMDKAWGVEDPYAFHLARVKSLITVGSVSALLLMSLAMSTLLHAAESIDVDGWLGTVAGLVNFGAQVALGLTSLFGSVLAALMLYRWLPSHRTPWRYCIPAAVIAGLSFVIIKNLFLFYLTTFANFDAVYGSLASLVVLLVWIYVTGFMILLVAELGGALREVNARSHRSYGRRQYTW